MKKIKKFIYGNLNGTFAFLYYLATNLRSNLYILFIFIICLFLVHFIQFDNIRYILFGAVYSGIISVFILDPIRKTNLEIKFLEQTTWDIGMYVEAIEYCDSCTILLDQNNEQQFLINYAESLKELHNHSERLLKKIMIYPAELDIVNYYGIIDRIRLKTMSLDIEITIQTKKNNINLGEFIKEILKKNEELIELSRQIKNPKYLSYIFSSKFLCE